MQIPLDGRVALVTGGSSCIGYAAALAVKADVGSSEDADRLVSLAVTNAQLVAGKGTLSMISNCPA